MTSVAVAQSTKVDNRPGETHYGIDAGVSILFTEPTNLGYRLGFTAQKNRFLGELSVEYAEDRYSSIEAVTTSYTTITTIQKYTQFVQVGLSGRISPFNSSLINPYISLQVGSLFAGNEFAFPLSASVGSEFVIQLASGNSLNPFVQYGYQYVFMPISNLDQNGSVLKVGLRYCF